MALSGNQITRSQPGGVGRAYSGFTAKAVSIVLILNVEKPWLLVHKLLGLRP